MRLGVVYKVSIGNNFIIGSTINSKYREKKYINNLRKGIWNNSYVQDSYNKYGEENFKWEILQNNIPEDILENVEDIWIGSLCGRAEDNKNGMNMRDAFRVRFGKETKEKMSISNSKTIYQYDLEGNFTREFIGAHDASNYVNSSYSNIATSARSGGNSQSGGFLWSYLFFEKMPKYNNSPAKSRRKTVLQFDKNGNFIKEWESITKIQKELGYNQGNIYKVIIGIRNSAHNFIWKHNKPKLKK